MVAVSGVIVLFVFDSTRGCTSASHRNKSISSSVGGRFTRSRSLSVDHTPLTAGQPCLRGVFEEAPKSLWRRHRRHEVEASSQVVRPEQA